MKRFFVLGFGKQIILGLAFLINNHWLIAQVDAGGTLVLQVCCNKTSSIVFPQIIKNVDRGSKDLLVQKVRGVDNVLQLKAGKENFPETNLTVITADGKLWPFIVQYVHNPQRLCVQLDSSGNIFKMLAGKDPSIYGVHDESYEMKLSLIGLYIQNNLLYFQIQLENNSTIPYVLDELRFYIKDKRQSKRTASQELEQVPLSMFGNTESVAAQSAQAIVVALPKFTIPDKKNFFVAVTERNGGRNLRLRIKNTRIVRATVLP